MSRKPTVPNAQEPPTPEYTDGLIYRENLLMMTATIRRTRAVMMAMVIMRLVAILAGSQHIAVGACAGNRVGEATRSLRGTAAARKSPKRATRY